LQVTHPAFGPRAILASAMRRHRKPLLRKGDPVTVEISGEVHEGRVAQRSAGWIDVDVNEQDWTGGGRFYFDDEGITWCQEWTGKGVNAFRVAVALAPPQLT
jgi:hypothetical protein